MGRLKQLSDYKNNIAMNFLQDEELIKAIVFNYSDFLTPTLPPEFFPPSLLYTRIFPYKNVPDIQGDPKTFLTMSFNFRPHKSGTTFKMGSVYFYVITHRSIIRTQEGLRTDFIINKIDEIFNMSDILGVTKMIFNDMSDFTVDSGGDWQGSSISYKSIDFN